MTHTVTRPEITIAHDDAGLLAAVYDDTRQLSFTCPTSQLGGVKLLADSLDFIVNEVKLEKPASISVAPPAKLPDA